MSREIVENVLSGTKAVFKAILNFEHAIERKKMENQKSKSTFSAILLTLTLIVAALWVSPAVAADKKMVTDPATGKMVTAPEYGGTLTYPYHLTSDTTDVRDAHYAVWLISGVNETLALGDWALDREKVAFKSNYVPLPAFTAGLMESWSQPDPVTYIVKVRQDVRWHNKAPVNARELTADDVVYNYQRNLVLGDFTERPARTWVLFNLPWESIEAPDKYTVVFKLKEPTVGAIRDIFDDMPMYILPPEVIEQFGNYADWRNMVGTGPIMLTDHVEGVSKTYTKSPDYWGYDPKYPQNRLPYIDQLRALYMPEGATRISALRTGKVDIIHRAGGTAIGSLDVIRSLKRTNPKIEVWGSTGASDKQFGLNLHKPPFDDIRVRHAMQMALDLETINETYFGGFSRWKPSGIVGPAVVGYHITFEEIPAEVKQYYTYDPEGAEKLLEEAGYPRGTDGIRLRATLDQRDVNDLGYTEIAIGYWAEIGVEVTINIVDTATFVSKRNEHTYEMITGHRGWDFSPATPVGWYRQGPATKHLSEYVGGIETPEMTAAYDAFNAATTIEEQQRAFKSYDMETIKRHNQIWGPAAPSFQANQPWVKGFNGEITLRQGTEQAVLTYLWIDQDLKKEMGF